VNGKIPMMKFSGEPKKSQNAAPVFCPRREVGRSAQSFEADSRTAADEVAMAFAWRMQSAATTQQWKRIPKLCGAES